MREKRSNPGVCMRGDRIALCGGHNGSQYLATYEQFGYNLHLFSYVLYFRGVWWGIILEN